MTSRLQWRIAVRDSSLDPTTKHVALTLDTYMNRHGIAWPSQPSLAAGTGRNVSTVYRALVKLERAGFIVIAHSRGRRSNLYSAVIPNHGTDAMVNHGTHATVADVLTMALEHPTMANEASNHGTHARGSRKEEVIRTTADHEGDPKSQNQNPVDPAVLELARRWLASHPI